MVPNMDGWGTKGHIVLFSNHRHHDESKLRKESPDRRFGTTEDFLDLTIDHVWLESVTRRIVF